MGRSIRKNADEWVSLTDASAALRVPYHTAHRWLLTATLAGCRRDGRWVVERASLQALIRERQAAAGGAAR